MEVNTVYLSLGSNLGDRLANLQNAIDELGQLVDVRRCSSVFESEPWGFDAETNFFNICLEVETLLSPEELLKTIKQIEKTLGRVKLSNERYESRLIDIDIIFYGKLIYFSQSLAIPHPKYTERAFVLLPLMELIPEGKDIVSGRTLYQITSCLVPVFDIKPIKHQIFINK